MDLAWPASAKTDPTTGLSTGEVTIDDAGKTTAGANSEIVKNIAHNKISINFVWTLVTGFLVMFMQAGFALVETGLCRAKNAAHTMAMNFMIYGLGMLGFWICGFAFMFGGVESARRHHAQPTLGQGIMLPESDVGRSPLAAIPWGCAGHNGFFLSRRCYDTAIFALFLFEMVFMDTTATIPTGAHGGALELQELLHLRFLGRHVPLRHLRQLGLGRRLARADGTELGLRPWRACDFAGSGVVHMCGGVIAIAGGMVIGPRLGKYGQDGKPRPIPAHDMPMVMLGTFILAFGWFGFNPGSTLAGTDNRIAIIAVNTMLAGAAASVGTMFTMYIGYRANPIPRCFATACSRVLWPSPRPAHS